MYERIYILVMNKHLTDHGDGVRDIAFSVENCRDLYEVNKRAYK